MALNKTILFILYFFTNKEMLSLHKSNLIPFGILFLK